MNGNANLSWREAIIQVLKEAAEPLDYHQIAERILEGGLRRTTGRTPANTVHRNLSEMIRDRIRVDGETIHKTPHGYARTSVAESYTVDAENEAGDPRRITFVNAYGLHWERGSVCWQPVRGNLWGYQTNPADRVDFAGQHGIYLLHHGNEIVYAGQTQAARGDTGLYGRLKSHNDDIRKIGRWNTFSWFGFKPIDGRTGMLNDAPKTFRTGDVITLVETILIESLLPRLNMRSGDHIRQARDSRLYFQWQPNAPGAREEL